MNLKFKTLALILPLIALGTSYSAHAQTNRDDDDKVFNAPANGGGTQWLLGIAELIGAAKIYPNMRKVTQTANNAESELAFAQERPTSEAARQKMIKAIKDNKDNYFTDELDDEPAAKVEKLQSAEIVTQAEKKELIASAEKALTKARAAEITALEAEGAVPKTIRGLKIVGSTLLVLDVLGRIYVWNALDANPTFSPGAKLIGHFFSGKKSTN